MKSYEESLNFLVSIDGGACGNCDRTWADCISHPIMEEVDGLGGIALLAFTYGKEYEAVLKDIRMAIAPDDGDDEE